MSGIRNVTVVGAGIAGLTAAQELAERGFCVQVIEAATEVDPSGRRRIAIGGLARTQYALVPLPVSRAALEGAARGNRRSVAATPLRQPHLWADAPDSLDVAAAALGGPYARFGVWVRTAGQRAALVARGVAAERIEVDPRPADPPIRLRAAVVPGEHGYRFFPAFYRHLHDTLGRIRLPGGRGSVVDHLVSPQDQALATQGRPVRCLPRARGGDLAGLQAATDAMVAAVGVTRADVARLGLRLLRYATTGPARRAASCEGQTSFDYLTAQDPDGFLPGAPPLPFSPAQLAFLRHSPRALVAMDGQHGEARTSLSVWLQLVLDETRPGPPVDAILDGPTTPALFDPWRAYLETLGVRFFSGRVRPLGPIEDPLELIADPVLPGGLDGFGAQADFVVLALDLVGARAITRGLDHPFVHALHRFSDRVPVAPMAPETQERDPETACGTHPWDRLQTLTGVQYGMGANTALCQTFLYVADSPWGLSSICQSHWWARPMVLGRDGCAGWISVDIGDARVAGPGGRSVWALDADGVAHETWDQLTAHLGTGPLPQPLHHHVDQWLDFGPDGLARNRAPYLVNPAGDWIHRPPGGPGAYGLLGGKLAFCGTWRRTHTRMTTMESANESARHAVNAILAAVQRELRPGAPPASAQDGRVPRATVVGDLCEIWPPEDHEAPSLRSLKDLDDTLFDRGLPHLATILDLETLPEGLAEEKDPVVALVGHLRRALERALALDPAVAQGLESILAMLGGWTPGGAGQWHDGAPDPESPHE